MDCFFCGTKPEPGMKYCPNCGAELSPKNTASEEDVIEAPEGMLSDDTASQSVLNSSGRNATQVGIAVPVVTGIGSIFAPENTDLSEYDKSRLRTWNWGAFLFQWVWALLNGILDIAAITFLLNFLFPMIGGLISGIYLGAKGNELLWARKKFASVDEFLEIQRKWSSGAILLILVVIGFMILAIFMWAFGKTK